MSETAPGNKRSKQAYLITCAVTTVVFVLSMILFHAVYIPWVNMILVALFYVTGMASVGAMTGLVLKSDEKKTYSKTGLTVRCLIVMALFTILIFGLSYYINLVVHLGSRLTIYADNECAIRIAYSAIIIMYGALLMIFISHLSGRKDVRLAAAAALIASVCVGIGICGRMIPTKFLYPAYRSVISQGGVKTDDGDIFFDFARATEKLQPTDNLGKDETIAITLAKNEREGLQLVLVSGKADRSVTVSVGDFTDGSGNKLPVRFYKERYVAVPAWGSAFSDDYPDALEPITDTTVIPLEKDRLQAIYAETVSNKETAAGTYTAKCEIKDETGKVIASPEISASVRDFTLHDTPATESAMGIFSSEFWKLMGLDESTVYGHNGDDGSYTLEEEQFRIYKQYYDYLLEHHITPYELPYDILDERADEYMSDPRVTSFCIPYPADDSLLQRYYAKVTSNPDWAEKGYFYPIDEPNDADAYARYSEITERLSRLCPGYNMVTPFFSYETDIENDDRSSVALQRGKSSILCPETVVLDAEGARDELRAARDEAGARLWWYVCCGPTGDYNNNFIRQDAIQHRILFWQEKMEDFTGILYWNSIYCDKGNPWETSKTWESYESAGDGVLMYPGRYMGYDEPVGTLRLKNWCDGIEDYTYLTLAEEKLGREWIGEKIALITTSLTDYTADYELLENVRNEIGSALEK